MTTNSMYNYIFLGLAFRANSHESVQNLQFDFDANKNYFKVENEGHFLGMVKLLAEENPELKAHLKQYKEDQANSERYKTTFMSDKFVKKALSVIREYLTKRIVEELKRNGTMYGIQMDTSQDVSVKEQCSIVIRYINDNLMVSERTIFFLESPCTTGESLYNLLKTSLDKIGLSTKDIAGFSFDGAQNMRSADAGVNHYIKKDNPRSLYTWCISHRLNIIVKNAFKSGLAKYILALVESTASFINSSYKRMNIWMEVVQGLKNVNSKIKLKIIGGVRWTSKHEAIHVVTKTEENFLAIIKTYLKICNLDSLENNALTKACNILNSWLDYENVLAAVIFDKIFCVLLPVTKDLQRTGLCLFEAIRLIKKLFTDINDIKNNYGKLLNDAKCFINKLNNLFSHDQYINSLDLGPDFFHIHVEDIKFDNVFIDNVIEPVIDNLLLGLEESFLDDFQDMMLYREISLLDLNFYKKCLEENNEISLKRLCVLNNITDSESVVQELYNFLKEYEEYEKDLHEVSMLNSGKKVQLQTHTKNDLIEQGTDSEEDEEPDEHEFNPLYIDSESDLDEDILNIEKTIVVKRKCYCVQCILRYFAIFDISAKKYANLYTLYKYVALLPCTETRCERDFSYLKMIKNCRRSLLIEKNLQSLMTICLESDLFKDIDLEDVVDEIAYTSTKLAKKLL